VRRFLAVVVLAVATLVAIPGQTEAATGAAAARVAFDQSHGFTQLNRAYAQRIGMSRASFERLTAPAGVETIDSRAFCSTLKIVKAAASGDVWGQACALHSTSTDKWGGWWHVSCHLHASGALQKCTFGIKYPHLVAEFNPEHDVWFAEAHLPVAATSWESQTGYTCTGFDNGEQVRFKATLHDSGFNGTGPINGYLYAVWFSNGKYTDHWNVESDLISIGSSCNIP
jgi:hypothetical protein